MTDLSELIERVKGWFGRKPASQTNLVWRCHCAGHPLSDDPCAAYYHVAQSEFGRFEIFEEGSNFLLSFPRRFRLPAELFADLREAKARALHAVFEQGSLT